MRVAITETWQRKIAAIKSIRRLVEFLAEAAGIRLNELSLVLVSNDGIIEINKKHLRRDHITDVISYLLPSFPGEKNLPSGEIFVNIQLASNAKGRKGWNRSRELALYIAHGIDHLAGEDDADRRGYLRMRRRELAWLRLAGEKGLLKGLMTKEKH